MKFLKLIALLLACTILFVGCGGGASSSSAAAPSTEGGAPSSESTPAASSGDKIIIKAGHVCPENHPVHIAFLGFKERVEARTNGAVEVQIYPNSLLGGEREMLEGVLMGSMEIYYGGSQLLNSYTSAVAFQALPFFFTGGKLAAREFFAEFGEDLAAQIQEEIGITVMWTDNSVYNPANSVKEIKTPEDFKGIKFRTQEMDIYIKAYELLGALPTPIATAEVYTGLQQGTINGVNSNIILLDQLKWHEVCAYYPNMSMFVDMGVTAWSSKWMDSLPEDIKTAVMEELPQFRDEYGDAFIAAEVEIRKDLESIGVTFTDYTLDERQMFIDASQPVYDWFRETYKDPMLDQYIEFLKPVNEKYA